MTRTRKRRAYAGPGLSFDAALGVSLNQYLMVHGITRAKLGEILGVAGSNVSQRIRGQVTWPVEDVYTIAETFGVTVDDLMPHRTDDGWVPAPYVPGALHDEAPAGVGGGAGVAPRTGFEPATFCSGGRRSIH